MLPPSPATAVPASSILDALFAAQLAATDPQVVPLLPMLKIPPLPIWLTVHREIRASRRIRAVYDFLAQAVPRML